jgi:hypothetical protein
METQLGTQKGKIYILVIFYYFILLYFRSNKFLTSNKCFLACHPHIPRKGDSDIEERKKKNGGRYRREKY